MGSRPARPSPFPHSARCGSRLTPPDLQGSRSNPPPTRTPPCCTAGGGTVISTRRRLLGGLALASLSIGVWQASAGTVPAAPPASLFAKQDKACAHAAP